MPRFVPLGGVVRRQSMFLVVDAVGGADEPLEVARMTTRVVCVGVQLVVGDE